MTKFSALSLAAIVALFTASGSLALDEAAQIELGKAEFLASCAACHGADGKGGGPVAEVMVKKPLDLTQIAKKYGAFSAEDMYQVIDGRRMVNPHGSRNMPVWGYRYLGDAIKMSQEVPHQINLQAMVYGRITALVKYIAFIQAD